MSINTGSDENRIRLLNLDTEKTDSKLAYLITEKAATPSQEEIKQNENKEEIKEKLEPIKKPKETLQEQLENPVQKIAVASSNRNF